MRGDHTRALEPMRSTLPNTDQPRIPHSEYHYNSHKVCGKAVSFYRRNVKANTHGGCLGCAFEIVRGSVLLPSPRLPKLK